MTHSLVPGAGQNEFMAKGDYIRIEKVGSTPNGLPACPLPLYSPASPETFQAILSLPISYWMDGYLEEKPEVGGRILLRRFVRCGVVVRGSFVSSPICRIEGDLITTYNSYWRVRRVPPLDPTKFEEQTQPRHEGQGADYPRKKY